MEAKDIKTAEDFRKHVSELAARNPPKKGPAEAPRVSLMQARIDQVRARRKALRSEQPPVERSPVPDPNMQTVAHFLHAFGTVTPLVREIVRRYVRQTYGELAAEVDLPQLPPLPDK